MVFLLPTVLYSIMLGIVLFGLLDVLNQSVSKQRPRQKHTIFLILILLLLLIHLSGELLIATGAYVHAPSLVGLQFPFRVLLGPALYFYAYGAMSPADKLPKLQVFTSLLGPILVITCMLPFLFMISPEQKLALADPATRDPELFKIAVFTCSSATFIFVCYTLVFLFMAFKLQQRHRQQLMQRFSDIEQKSLDWFKPLLILWGAVWVSHSLEFYLNVMQLNWFGSGLVLPCFEIVALAIFVQKALRQKPLAISDKEQLTVQQPRVALLSAVQMDTIAQKLSSAMQQGQLFLTNDLSLKTLAESINETENHISETLSQHLHTNFFHYANSFRIEEAKTALRETEKLIINIAYDVGFNSKSTFNSAFKKAEGCSPSAYRQQVAANA